MIIGILKTSGLLFMKPIKPISLHHDKEKEKEKEIAIIILFFLLNIRVMIKGFNSFN